MSDSSPSRIANSSGPSSSVDAAGSSTTFASGATTGATPVSVGAASVVSSASLAISLLSDSGKSIEVSVPLPEGTITYVDQADVLIRSLIIAAVIVAPYAVYKIRQVSRLRQSIDSAKENEAKAAKRAELTYGHIPALEDVIADVSFVVEEATRNGGAMLVVPHEVTVSNRPATPEIVDALIRDALRRSNLVVTAEADSDEGRMLECALINASDPVESNSQT